MSLKQIFHYFIKNDSSLKQMKKKIILLENKLAKYEELESLVNEIQELKKQKRENSLQPPIVVERLNVEKLTVDKVELNNTFGQLGIKDLQGRLNIGATYGEGSFYDHLKTEGNKENKEEKSSEEKRQHEKNVQAPKINVRAR